MISLFPVSKCSWPGSSSFPVSLSLSSTWLAVCGAQGALSAEVAAGGISDQWVQKSWTGPYCHTAWTYKLNLLSADLLCNRLMNVHVNMLAHPGDLFCGI